MIELALRHGGGACAFTNTHGESGVKIHHHTFRVAVSYHSLDYSMEAASEPL